MNKATRLALAVALLAISVSPAAAASIGSGPLRVKDLETYGCSVVNVSAKPVDVQVVVSINGGGSGVSKSCPALAPNAVCVAENDAGSFGYRFCTATVSSKKAVRGSFCDVTSGVCVPVQ
jgi:hypothetical protein